MSTSTERSGQQVGKAIDSLSSAAAATATRVEAAASEQLDKVEAAIRRNPLASAGIAAGIGFLLAVIARR